MDNLDVLTDSPGTQPSTGRKAFGQIKIDVAMNFGVDKDPERMGLVGRMIHSVIDDLNRRKLWQFNLITASPITTVSGTADYSVPTDMWRIYNIRKTDSIDFTLSGASQRMKDLIFMSQNGITGYPYIHTGFNIFRDGTFSVFPVPDGAYTLLMRYFRLIGKPTADDEYLDIPPPYQSVIEYGGNLKMAAFSESRTLGFWKGEFEQAYAEMNVADEDPGDEDLRIINIEELGASSFVNPNGRPRLLDWY